MSTKTENRRPHTVYLTDELWEMLDRRHLETRLSSSTPPSKIEFIEQVLKAGMEALADATEDRSSPEKNRRRVTRSIQGRAEKTATTDQPAAKSPIAGSAQQDEREVVEKTVPATAPPVRRPPRRSSALERLVQASEPGRPAPINSAATSENQETKEPQ